MEAILKAREYVLQRQMQTSHFMSPGLNWPVLTGIARELRSAPLRTDKYGLPRLLRWHDVAEYVQREFPELAEIKTASLASAICQRYHATYKNERTRICKTTPKLQQVK